MALGFNISIQQSGRNPRLYQVGSAGEIANFQDLAESVQETLIDVSLQEFKQARDNEGFDPKPRVSVDNRYNKSIFDVNPFGQIEFQSRLSETEVIFGIYREIWDKTPVVTGQYKSGNYVFLNNRVVATTPQELKSFVRAYEKIGFDERDVIRFINVNPYARKLETLGVSKGRTKPRSRAAKAKKAKAGTRVSVPNGAYALAYRTSRRKYKQATAFMKYGLLVNGRYGINIKSSGKFRNSFIKTGQPYLYPMISFSFSEQGVLR